MSIDPTRFSSVSVTDTCAIWNMLSSARLNKAAVRAELDFCITPVVLYECLSKPRQSVSPEQAELMDRLRQERGVGRFPVKGCSLDDLIAVSSAAPGRLGAGELSCMATAYGIGGFAFMTDERLAFRYAKEALHIPVETTPRLYGYLHYHKHLNDSDHTSVIAEHEKFERRPLTRFFQEAYEEAMRFRLMDASFSPASFPESDGNT